MIETEQATAKRSNQTPQHPDSFKPTSKPQSPCPKEGPVSHPHLCDYRSADHLSQATL